VGGAFGLLLGGAFDVLVSGLFGDTKVVPIFVLIVGTSGGLKFGFASLIQHYALRNILIKKGFFPKSLLSFLEHAVNFIFLRRVGGSYIFVHRTLMEHFAELDVEKP